MKHRGVCILICIALIGTTAAVLTAVSGSVRLQTQRTTTAIEEAQASQLLRAGIAIAADQAKRGKTQDGFIPTPLGQVSLKWAGQECTIDAALPHVRRAVRETF